MESVHFRFSLYWSNERRHVFEVRGSVKSNKIRIVKGDYNKRGMRRPTCCHVKPILSLFAPETRLQCPLWRTLYIGCMRPIIYQPSHRYALTLQLIVPFSWNSLIDMQAGYPLSIYSIFIMSLFVVHLSANVAKKRTASSVPRSSQIYPHFYQ